MTDANHQHALPGTWQTTTSFGSISGGLTMDSADVNHTTGYCSICDVEFAGTFAEAQQLFIDHEHCFICYTRWHLDNGIPASRSDMERLWSMTSKYESQVKDEG